MPHAYVRQVADVRDSVADRTTVVSANAVARFTFTLNVPIQEIPADREPVERLVFRTRM